MRYLNPDESYELWVNIKDWVTLLFVLRNYSCGIAYCYAVVRNITDDDCRRSNRHIVADGDISEHDGVCGDFDVVANFRFPSPWFWNSYCYILPYLTIGADWITIHNCGVAVLNNEIATDFRGFSKEKRYLWRIKPFKEAGSGIMTVQSAVYQWPIFLQIQEEDGKWSPIRIFLPWIDGKNVIPCMKFFNHFLFTFYRLVQKI